MADAIDWYDRHAGEVADGYERLDAERLYAWVADLMPPAPARALDIGAGTGRDAAWLAARGYRTTAVEPCRAMRTIAAARHPEAAVDWVDDRLPDLRKLEADGAAADLVLMNAVWMHLDPADRTRAFPAVARATAPPRTHRDERPPRERTAGAVHARRRPRRDQGSRRRFRSADRADDIGRRSTDPPRAQLDADRDPALEREPRRGPARFPDVLLRTVAALPLRKRPPSTIIRRARREDRRPRGPGPCL